VGQQNSKKKKKKERKMKKKKLTKWFLETAILVVAKA
jgi:hypothetical protein